MDLGLVTSQPRVLSSMISAIKNSSKNSGPLLPTMPKVQKENRVHLCCRSLNGMADNVDRPSITEIVVTPYQTRSSSKHCLKKKY